MTNEAMTNETIDSQILQLRRWLEGYIDDDGKHRPGIVELVGELYAELELRRDRREMVTRAIVGGTAVTCCAALLAWLKDHLK